MFTGIVEDYGIISDIQIEGSNKHFVIESKISKEAYIDQSISHNGVCLTVVKYDEKSHTVTAIEETLKLSNLDTLKVGDFINLERCMLPTTRMDGHMVQGHVDTTGICKDIKTIDGSWYFTFSLPQDFNTLVVSKGSICVNGVSLTVVEPTNNEFKVAIIPYTYEHTNFKAFEVGSIVNLEFDIIGKYVQQYIARVNAV